MSLTYLSSAERRARAILDAYGSRPAAWPADERQVTLECIAHSPALQQYQTELADLDQRIQSEQAAALPAQADVLALQQRILARLPVQAETSVTKTMPRWQHVRAWLARPRPAIALAGLAVLAIVMLMPRPQPPAISSQVAGQYETWSWYDITGQDLPAANTTTALTMTDLLDLEMDEDGV